MPRPPVTDRDELGVRSRRMPLGRAAMLTFGTQVGMSMFGLVNVLVMSRALGPDGRGEFVLLTTIAAITTALSTLGVEQSLANLTGTRSELRPSLATNAIVLAVGFGMIAAGLLLGITVLVPGIIGDADPGLRWFAIAAVPVLILRDYQRWMLLADYRFVVVNTLLFITPVLQLTLNGSLALAGELTVPIALGAWVGGQAIEMLLIVGYRVRRLEGFGRPDWRLVPEMVSFGLKAHGGRVLLVGNYRFDQWILGAIAGSRELGLYSVAVAWSEALFFLPQACAMVQRADLVRATREEAVFQAARVYRAAVLLTLPLVAGMILLAPFLCATIFGESFRGSVDDLRVLALGALGIATLKILGNALTAQAKPLLETGAVTVAFCLTIALDFALIPPYGGLGAAIASALAYTVGGVAVSIIFVTALHGSARALVPRAREIPWFIGKIRSGVRGR